MSEIYTGTKFKFESKGEAISEIKNIKLLKKWCSIFNKEGFAPLYNGGSSGNLSFRTNSFSNKFIITASHTALNNSMHKNDFSEVVFCSIENNTVHAKGKKEPSSETLMHYLIYKTNPEINAIFHGHSTDIMKIAKQHGFPETKKEYDYGTVDLAKEVVNTLKNHNFVIIKNHGFISVGKTMEKAGNNVLNLKTQNK